MEHFTLSEIRLFSFSYAPSGWAVCDGSLLPIALNQSLYTLLGNRFGGDGSRTFALPDLRGRVVVGSGNGYSSFSKGGENSHALTASELPKHSHQAIASTHGVDSNTPANHFWAADTAYRTESTGQMNDTALEATGKGLPHDNLSPFVSLNYCIAIAGINPTLDYHSVEGSVGSISVFSNVVQEGNWMVCDGRLLPIGPFVDLYSAIGTTYGGDGERTFAIPDLRGRAAVAAGHPSWLSAYSLGEKAGQEKVTLTKSQMPVHSHHPLASLDANSQQPEKMTWGVQNLRPAPNVFATEKGDGAVMHEHAIGETGGDAPHNNMMAYQTMQYMIRAHH
jgi:microcystin-dependent protein